MAKKAMINKELRREKLVAAGKYPAVRLHNRCSICGRPHGYHRDFGLCRICLRKLTKAYFRALQKQAGNASELRAKRRREGGGVVDPLNANEQEGT